MHSGETCSYDLDGECRRWPGYVLVDECHPDATPDTRPLVCWRHQFAIVAFNRAENPGHAWAFHLR